jgi:putative peptidoglycan lipid II flippase
LFQYDQFDAFAAHKSALSLIAYGSGLMAFIMVKILAPVFLSRGDTKTPVKVGVIAMVSNVFLNIIFAYYFAHVGLAIATSISAVINASLLYYYLNKQSIFNVSNDLIKMFFKVLLASFIMVIFILNFSNEVNFYLEVDAWQRITSIAMTIGAAAVIYFVCLRLLGIRMEHL